MRQALCVVLAAAVLTLASAAEARGPGHGHRGGYFAGPRGRHGGVPHHRVFRHRGVFVPHAFIGAPFVWDPFWYAPPASPPVIIERGPQVYVQKPQPSYWYYCADAGAYYPYVQQCPNGWMKVVPPE